MKVLWVSTDLTTRGGVSSSVRTMALSPLWHEWGVSHLATHRDGSGPRKVAVFAGALVRLCAQLLWRRPDLVHVHTASRGSFVRKATVFWLATLARVPVVVHVHGGGFDRFHDRAPMPMRLLVRATLNHAVAVIALSDSWAEKLAAIAPAARITVLPNAVRVRPREARLRDGDLVRVVFAGRVGARKGAFDLLDAWSRLAPGTRAGASLVLLGDGEVERARHQAQLLGVAATCEVRGWVPAAETQAELDRSDVFVLPSHAEGQPMAMLEAMAAGCCVVATSVGGIPELIEDERSGLLVGPGDVGALAAALERALSDGPLRARLAAAAVATVVATCELGLVAARLDALYRAVTADRTAVAG